MPEIKSKLTAARIPPRMESKPVGYQASAAAPFLWYIIKNMDVVKGLVSNLGLQRERKNIPVTTNFKQNS